MESDVTARPRRRCQPIRTRRRLDRDRGQHAPGHHVDAFLPSPPYEADRGRGVPRSLDALFRWVTSADAVIAVLATEAGTPVLFPHTQARRDKRRWRVDGRKTFGRLSSAADLFFVHVKVVDGPEDHPELPLYPEKPADSTWKRTGTGWGCGRRAATTSSSTVVGCLTRWSCLWDVGGG